MVAGGHVAHEITITHEGTFIKVLSNGEKNYQFAVDLWTAIHDACLKYQCFNVLGIADTTVPVDTYDALEIADLFEQLEIDGKFRIAWVELNPRAYKTTFFIESVLSNRGLPSRVFLEIDEAKNWLLGSSES